MPRKKKPAAEAAPGETAADTSTAPPDAGAASQTPIPESVDGLPGAADAPAEGSTNPDAKNWGNPYKAIFVCREKGFEMGEDRRFKQRVFRFADRPADEILARLKDAGFTYRGAEKTWTIQANPDTRRLADELAQEFAGKSQGMSL